MDEEKIRLRLTLEYDGTDFSGFQLQGKGERTVQGVLERALERLAGRPVRVHGAGRTDAGVHALGQVAHCDVGWGIPLERVAAALNANLPRDLSVRAVSRVEPGFHARFDATSRTYRYALWNRPTPSALLARYVWHVPQPLALRAMRAAAAELVGTHDFGAFGRPEEPGRSAVRRVMRLEVRPWKGCFLITVQGNAFLRQMARALVGTLQQAGTGRLDAAAVRRIRESRDRGECPPIAPPQGLCLVRVSYDGVREPIGIGVSQKVN